MSLEKEKLSKLTPEDRIKRLQELEEERKRELQEIDELLKESQKDLKTDSLADRIVPPRREVDIQRLFSNEEDAESIPPATAEPEQETAIAPEYMARVQMYQDYERLKEMLDYDLEPAKMSDQEMQRLDQIESRLKHAAGYIVSADDQAQLLSATRLALKRVKKYAT